MALRVIAVSMSVSPFFTEDWATDMFITLAPRRLPASSKLAWVRVEASKKHVDLGQALERVGALVGLAVERDVGLGEVEDRLDVGAGEGLDSEEVAVREQGGPPVRSARVYSRRARAQAGNRGRRGAGPGAEGSETGLESGWNGWKVAHFARAVIRRRVIASAAGSGVWRGAGLWSRHRAPMPPPSPPISQPSPGRWSWRRRGDRRDAGRPVRAAAAGAGRRRGRRRLPRRPGRRRAGRRGAGGGVRRSARRCARRWTASRAAR